MNQLSITLGTQWPVWLWMLTLAAFAGAGVLAWLGYRRHAAEVGRSRLRLLTALRAAAWTLLLLCLLNPLRLLYSQENKSSRLTVLADDSQSMLLSDTRQGPTRAQRVQNCLIGEQAANALRDGRTGVEPDAGSLLQKLSCNFNVWLESMGGTARSLAQGGGQTLAQAVAHELKADFETTDIAKSLEESFARLKGQDAGGLVLLSDGADTAHGDLDRVAERYKRAGIPIYVLGVGAEDVADMAVTQVRCRRNVSKDTLVRVEVDIKRVNIAEKKHTVCIKRGGRIVGSPAVVEMKGDKATAIFEFLPDELGFLEYEAVVDAAPGEIVTGNNKLDFGLMAFSRKLRVLYMEGSAFIHSVYSSKSEGMTHSHPMQKWWEHQFLERALTEDMDVEVDVLAKDEFAIPRNASQVNLQTVKSGYPKTRKDLYKYDVIISSDIPYSRFSEEQVKWTVEFVGKHGGGFVMIGGYDAFGEGGYSKTAFDRMLPVEMLPGDKHLNNINFNWQVTDKGWQHPIMRIEKDDEANRKAWERLPPFHGFSRTTRTKPGADELAVVDNEEDFGTLYGAATLLAVQKYGKGFSMAFTTDCTGGWGTEWEDSWGPADQIYASDWADRNKHYKTFWKNAIRWLAQYRMQAPNQLVQIETEQLVYGRGDDPVVRVKVLTPDYEPTHEAEVALKVLSPDGTTRQVTVFPRYEEPGIYERKLEAGQIGRYEIEASATLNKEALDKDKAVLQIRPAAAETRQLSQDAGLLKRLADKTGGVYLPIERAAELPRHLREATHTVEKYREENLWNNVWVFIAIIGLLCGEWYLRKRSGLA
jgi:uncharacterized membrane protein